jgi:hypothetical protein
MLVQVVTHTALIQTDSRFRLQILGKQGVQFEKAQPFLTDKEYMAKASYAELRLAIKILGIRATIFPLHGNYPYRHQIDVTVPEVLAKWKRMSG